MRVHNANNIWNNCSNNHSNKDYGIDGHCVHDVSQSEQSKAWAFDFKGATLTLEYLIDI